MSVDSPLLMFPALGCIIMTKRNIYSPLRSQIYIFFQQYTSQCFNNFIFTDNTTQKRQSSTQTQSINKQHLTINCNTHTFGVFVKRKKIATFALILSCLNENRLVFYLTTDFKQLKKTLLAGLTQVAPGFYTGQPNITSGT